MSYLQRLVDAQNSDLHAARSYIDRAESESREMSVEERTAWDNLNAQMDERAAHIEQVKADEARSAYAVEVAPEVADARIAGRDNSIGDQLRALVNGDIRAFNIERRDLNTSDDSSIVPETFLPRLQEALVTVGPMLDPNVVTLINTDGGEDLVIPVESTRPAATAIAEATTITALDPTFSSITLKSQKVQVLTKASRELLTDAGFDVEAYLGRMFGIALGVKINNLLTVGTGTTVPNGLFTAAGSGITGGTGVSGAFTADNLIDLAHSVDGAYVRLGGAWQMNRASLGAVRKLKDGQGMYLFQPAATVGTPDTLLGFPVFDNPDAPAIAVGAKSVTFGWHGSYHVRQVGAIEIARSDDAYFADDQIGFRATMRVWGDLGQSAAVKTFAGGTA
ncbi:MAG TPA: phage major capsid protein [Acidimicrobiia bacterium]